MATIAVGAKREETLLVTSDVSIDFLGLDTARVLSTPHMIGFMERTCRNLLLESLEKGYDSVGTQVTVSHLAGAPIGVNVIFVAEVIAVTEKRVTFKVEAATEKEKIGEGTHERAIINVQRFAERLQAKKG